MSGLRVALVDYDSGNLHSAHKALERAAREAELPANIEVTRDPERIASADRIVLPGVGAFADCRRGLDAADGLVPAMAEAVGRGTPFLGVCVGMQLLGTRGHEFGTTPGLGWVPGDVRPIRPADPGLKVPHMGWNALEACRPHPLLDGVPTGEAGLHAYFVHSFALTPDDAGDVIATTDHGGPVVAMVARGNVAGVQFHPEKSQALGLRLLANFLRAGPTAPARPAVAAAEPVPA